MSVSCQNAAKQAAAAATQTIAAAQHAASSNRNQAAQQQLVQSCKVDTLTACLYLFISAQMVLNSKYNLFFIYTVFSHFLNLSHSLFAVPTEIPRVIHF